MFFAINQPLVRFRRISRSQRSRLTYHLSLFRLLPIPFLFADSYPAWPVGNWILLSCLPIKPLLMVFIIRLV